MYTHTCMHCTCEIFSLSRHSHNHLGRNGACLTHVSDVTKETVASKVTLAELNLLLLTENFFILKKLSEMALEMFIRGLEL